MRNTNKTKYEKYKSIKNFLIDLFAQNKKKIGILFG